MILKQAGGREIALMCTCLCIFFGLMLTKHFAEDVKTEEKVILTDRKALDIAFGEVEKSMFLKGAMGYRITAKLRRGGDRSFRVERLPAAIDLEMTVVVHPDGTTDLTR